MSKKVVTLGEVMLRLSVPDFQRLVQVNRFNVTYGGGEANFAAALCGYGLDVSLISKVPDNALGQSAVNHLRRYGVNTQHIIKGGRKLGIYFLETGTSMRASKVVYDRTGTSISDADISEFDFDKIFDGVDWFHITGVTPALSAKAAILTEVALKAAKIKGITTSIDLNYRRKLWSKKKAKEVLSGLFQHIDVCIGIDNTLGFISKDIGLNGDLDVEGYKDLFQYLKEKFRFKYIVSTLRESKSASDNFWSALVYDGNEFYHTKQYDIRIVDRVGSGDSFAGGFICGLITGLSMKDATEFGVAASVIKHTIPGDLNHATIAEIRNLMDGTMSF